jgi:Uma2 family endonuclease
MPIADKYRPHYTYDDYCQWEGKWELIEGMPYAMSPSPVPAHQRASLLLSIQFEKALSCCKNCKIYPPLDWKITDDTIVQPDLLVVCDKIEKKYLDFAPSLIIEIISPSTASKDRGEKMELYQSQGVKYYIIVDPQFKKTEVYELVKSQYQPIAINPESFTFSLKDECTATVNLLDIWD